MLSTDAVLANAVDAVAYHWHAAIGGGRGPANEELYHRLDGVETIAQHPVRQRIVELASGLGRGDLVAAALRVAAGGAPKDRPGLHGELSAFALALRDFEAQCGAELCRQSSAERLEAQRQVQALCAGLDPIADLSRLLREPLALELAVVPSLLLPPPQEGRHGASLTGAGRTRAWLSFGHPLSEAPERYGINREFLIFGAWSYALRAWLARVWVEAVPPEEWAPWAEWAERELGRDRERTLEEWVKAHLDLALRSALGERLGTTRTQFRLMARARGLDGFDWFADWLDSRLSRGTPLRSELGRLPQALLGARAELQHASTPEFPTAINLLLMSRQRGAPSLVVPDCWSEAWCCALAACWSPLRLPLVRHHEWCHAVTAGGPSAGQSAIAVGSPQDNPLVASILDRHGLRLDELDHLSAPLLAWLERPAEPTDPWFLLLAARDSGAARALPLEVLLRVTAAWAWFDGHRVVRSGGHEPGPAAAKRSINERHAI